jgi:nitrate reductase gamma subunit
MIDSFLFVGLPYIAIAACIVGTIYRLRSESFTQSALSSQFLESKQLVWGSLPWHIGIGLIVLAHLAALLFPGVWRALMHNQTILYATETAGVALAVLAIMGLTVLIIRRVTSSRIQAVTSAMDLVILTLLFFQIVLGLLTALLYRWGALWSTASAVPYVWSLLTLQPDAAYVAAMPPVIKGHILLAWLIVLLIPFSRLVHMFALPLDYLFRAPQKVVWTNPRHEEGAVVNVERAKARRYFIKGAVGVVAGGTLFSVGAADKVFRFFFGPRLPEKEETKLMAIRLHRHEKSLEFKKYELERQQNDYIFIAKLSELTPTKGKYFIDYEMHPALAFKDTDGLPLLISAKCTHLGCTVGAECDSQGKLLCPCHVSYFDIHTGMPNADSPAKAPLAHIGWVLMDQDGKMVASRHRDGKLTGSPDPGRLDTYSVFIARYHERAEEA